MSSVIGPTAIVTCPFLDTSPYLQVQCTGCTRRNLLLEARNIMVAQCLLRSFGDDKDNLIAAMSCSLPQVTNVAATKAQSIAHAVHWMYGLRRSQTKLHHGSCLSSSPIKLSTTLLLIYVQFFRCCKFVSQ